MLFDVTFHLPSVNYYHSYKVITLTVFGGMCRGCIREYIIIVQCTPYSVQYHIVHYTVMQCILYSV